MRFKLSLHSNECKNYVDKESIRSLVGLICSSKWTRSVAFFRKTSQILVRLVFLRKYINVLLTCPTNFVSFIYLRRYKVSWLDQKVRWLTFFLTDLGGWFLWESMKKIG